MSEIVRLFKRADKAVEEDRCFIRVRSSRSRPLHPDALRYWLLRNTGIREGRAMIHDQEAMRLYRRGYEQEAAYHWRYADRIRSGEW